MTHTEILLAATPAQLERAAALNHTALFGMDAVAIGGELRQKDGLTWTWTGPGIASGAVRMFTCVGLM